MHTHTHVISNADHEMFLHLLAPQAEPARALGRRWPFGRGRALAFLLLLLPLTSGCYRPLVKEEILLRSITLGSILDVRNHRS